MAVKTVPVAGQYGVIADQPPQELPVNAWTRAVNIRFKDGLAERMNGEYQIFTTTSVVPYYVDAYQTGTKRYFVHAGLVSVFADDGVTRTNITNAAPYTGAQDDRWTGGTLNGVWIANNGVDKPQFWGGNVATPMATLTAWPATYKAGVVRPFKNYLVALNITKGAVNYPNMVKWSSSAVPGAIPASWDETDPTKDAGEVDLSEESSQLIDCMPLGDMNVIYKERAMYGQYPGGYPYVWTFRRLPGGVGALGRGCVAESPLGHVVLTAGDVIVHNGQGPRSIINARLRNDLFNNIDSSTYKRSWVMANPSLNEVWVAVTQVGDSVPSKVYIWNYTDDTWTTRDLIRAAYGAVGQVTTGADTWASTSGTWATDTGYWNQDPFSPASARLLTCSTDSRISLVDSGGDFNGTAYASVLERTGLHLDAPEVVKTMNAIEPRFTAIVGTQVQITFGSSMDVEGAVTWGTPIVYTVGSSYRAYSFVTGRFLAVRFTSLDNNYWRLKSYDIHYTTGGRW